MIPCIIRVGDEGGQTRQESCRFALGFVLVPWVTAAVTEYDALVTGSSRSIGMVPVDDNSIRL